MWKPLLRGAAGFALIALFLVASPPTSAGLARDRAYVANEMSGTVTVIDTLTNAITATVCLGSDPAIPGTPQPPGPCNAEADHHRPLYNGHSGTHGLWLSPKGRVLLATNRLTSSVVAIDTDAIAPGSLGSDAVVGQTPPRGGQPGWAAAASAEGVIGYAPVGREPHLATIHPDGNEAWVAVRGEDYVDILRLDPRVLFNPDARRTARLPHLDTVGTMRGPSMVSFTSDGRYALIAGAKESSVEKIDVHRRRTVARQNVSVPFSPFGLVTPDDKEFYLVHKLAGTLSVLRTSDLSIAVRDLPIGPCANHVFFVGPLAYITIGGTPPCAPGGVDREGKVVTIDRAAHAIVNEITGPAFTGDPHGIWATPDGRRLYVGHERGNRVSVIDLGDPDDPFDDVVSGTVSGSPEDLAFIKQPIDIVSDLRGVAVRPGVPSVRSGLGPAPGPRPPSIPGVVQIHH